MRADQSRKAEEPGYLGRLKAAQFCDVNPQTIDKFIREGRLRAFKFGRRVLVRRADLIKLVERAAL